MSRTQYTMLTCSAIALLGCILVGWRISSLENLGRVRFPVQIINQSGVAIEQIGIIGVRGNTTYEFGSIGSYSTLESSVPLGFMYEDQQIFVSDSTGIISKNKYTAPDLKTTGSIEYQQEDVEGNTLVKSNAILSNNDIRPKKFVIKITDDLKAHIKSEWQLDLSI